MNVRRRLAVAGGYAAALAAAAAAGLLAAVAVSSFLKDPGLAERRGRVADHYAEALATALWRYDLVGARQQLNGLLLQGDVVGVRLDGDGGRLALEAGETQDDGPQGAAVVRRALAAADVGGQTIIGVATFSFADADAAPRRLALSAGLAAALVAGMIGAGLAEAARRRWHDAPLRDVLARLSSAGLPVPADGDLRGLSAAVGALAADLAHARATAAAAAQDAKAAAQVKSAFLANVSHELRTPLNGVIGLLTLLLEQPLSPQQRGYVRSALSSAENLLTLVNDLLDMTQLEAGKMPLRVVAVDLRALMSETAALMAPRAAQRENTLHCELRADAPVCVLADAEKLRRILVNLLGNAVKFTKRGEIVARAAVTAGGDDGSALLRLEVEDNGIGIPADQKERLFQRFFQVDQSATRDHEGSGLGLAICRELCQLMGGRIGVDSTPGVGSRFWVELPVVAAPDRMETPSLPALRILVVDDIALNRILLSEILKMHGHQPLEAADGQAALALLETGDVCDAVLMDIEMPDMDGCETTRRLRALPAPAGGLPVVAVTANVDADAQRRFAENGVDDWLVKPVGWPEIAAALLRARDAARRRASPPSDAAAGFA